MQGGFRACADAVHAVWRRKDEHEGEIGAKEVVGMLKQEGADGERNEGDEGFVEDYIDHNDEERVEMSHPDNLSTSSRDEEPGVSQQLKAL